MSSKKSLRQLTAAELLDACAADPSSRKLRAEVDRRLDAGDAELDSEAARRLGKAAANLLPPVPKGLLTAVQMRGLKDRDLERYWSNLRQKCEFEMSAPTPDTVDWLERWIIKFRKQLLKASLADVAREMKRRDLSGGSKVATKKVGLRRRPAVSTRQTIVANHPTLDYSELCSRFDFEGVPLPTSWEHVRTWRDAYRTPETRRRIQTMISKDRRRARERDS